MIYHIIVLLSEPHLGNPADEPLCSLFVTLLLFVKFWVGKGMGISSWLEYICRAPSKSPS